MKINPNFLKNEKNKSWRKAAPDSEGEDQSLATQNPEGSRHTSANSHRH